MNMIGGSTSEKLNVIFYLRKSKKIETGMTFETQYKSCKSEVVKVFGKEIKPIISFTEDDVSGGDSSRKEYCQMKEFIKNNKCVLCN